MVSATFCVKYSPVAAILHSSPNYVYTLIRKGYLPVVRLGSIKILKQSLEKFLIENQGKDLSNLEDIKPLDFSKIGE